MCAANCGRLVSTRTNWANKAKEIVADTGKRVEVANSLSTTRARKVELKEAAN
jgi:hypothetical protein